MYLQLGSIILLRDMRSPMDFGQPAEIKARKFAPVPHRIYTILSESEVTSRFDDIRKELHGRKTHQDHPTCQQPLRAEVVVRNKLLCFIKFIQF
jgi:hypothetical protein